MQKRLSNAYPITVDYGQTLSEMISSGAFTYVNCDLGSGGFSIQGEGVHHRTVVLLSFLENFLTPTVLQEISNLDGAKYRPATIEELIVFATAHPEIQRQFPILALGSIWNTGEENRVPAIWGSSTIRSLFFLLKEWEWTKNHRFAVTIIE